jgi:hypothetical protein
VALYFGGQSASPGDEFFRRELVRGRGSAVDEICDAVAVAQQLALLRRMQLPRSESAAVQRRPETVSRSCEVMPGRGGVETGVDSNEQYLEPRRDDVPDAPARRGRDFLLTRPDE